MSTKLDDISVAIGALQSEVLNNRDNLRRAVDEINGKLTRIVDNLDKLPPSPVCLAEHARFSQDINALKLVNAKHSVMYGGVAGGLVIFGKLLAEKLGLISMGGS